MMCSAVHWRAVPSLHVYLHVHPQSLSDSQRFQLSAQSQSKHCQRECLQCRAPSELDAGRISTPHGRRSSQQPTCWLTWSKFEEEEGVCRWRGGSGGGQAAGNCQVVSRPTSLRCAQLIKTTSVLDGPLPQGEGVEKDTRVHARSCMCATCGSAHVWGCFASFRPPWWVHAAVSLVFCVSGVPDLPRPLDAHVRTHTPSRLLFLGLTGQGSFFSSCAAPCLSVYRVKLLAHLDLGCLAFIHLCSPVCCFYSSSPVWLLGPCSLFYSETMWASLEPLEIHTFTLLFLTGGKQKHDFIV